MSSPSDSISWICMGRLFHNAGVVAENVPVPKVTNMRPSGHSKTTEWCNLNEYAEQDLMLAKSLGDMPCTLYGLKSNYSRTRVTQTLKGN